MELLSDLIIDYSWWSVVLAFIAGIAYAGFLYSGKNVKKFNKTARIALSILRFLSVSLLAFLLLNPSVKTKSRYVEKPVVVVGVDNSASMVSGNEIAIINDSVNVMINTLSQELDDVANVEIVLFGDKSRLDNNLTFEDNISDYSNFFTFVDDNFTDLNLSSVVLFGDGIFNRGVDPVSASSALKVPVYSLAMGDTLAVSDISIEDTRYNSIVYNSDVFPVEISVGADGFKGHDINLRIFDGNRFLSSEKIRITDNSFIGTHTFNINAENSGKKRYKIIVDSIDGEQNTANNSRNIFVNILDSRHKILIYAFAPHPDLGALKSSILTNNNYTVDVAYSSSFKGDFPDYDLVILHQIPAMRYSAVSQLKKIKEIGIPVMFVVGKNTNIPVLNRNNSTLDIIGGMNSYANARFNFNDRFVGFSYNEDFQQQLSDLPPLITFLGNYKVNDNAQILGYQNINNVKTDFPLIVFNSDANSKECVITGEGLWLWRMQSGMKYDNTAAFDELIQKSMLLLLAGNDNRKFKVIANGEYLDSDDIRLRAELFNDAFEPFFSAAVKIKITDADGLDYDFQFVSGKDGYIADLGNLPVGVYSYHAVAETGKDDLVESGEFVVDHIDLENRELVADHRMLNMLSTLNNGKLFYADNFDELVSVVKNDPSLVSKVHFEYSFTNIISYIPVLLLIILLLSLEWFIRKYSGNY